MEAQEGKLSEAILTDDGQELRISTRNAALLSQLIGRDLSSAKSVLLPETSVAQNLVLQWRGSRMEDRMLLQSEVVPLLVEALFHKLQSWDAVEIAAAAAEVLAELAALSPSIQEHALELGAISPLVKLLRAAEDDFAAEKARGGLLYGPRAQIIAANALTSLARDSSSGAQRAERAGVIKDLVHMLQQPPCEETVAAVKALIVLRGPDAYAKVRQLGGVPILLEHICDLLKRLGSINARALLLPLVLLEQLNSSCDRTRALVKRIGGAQIMLKVLARGPPEEVAGVAQRILQELSADESSPRHAHAPNMQTATPDEDMCGATPVRGAPTRHPFYRRNDDVQHQSQSAGVHPGAATAPVLHMPMAFLPMMARASCHCP
ncbi:hypothetical protein WJX72_002456 [[Myrmecia] bisecta]|uniref:Uncharacterized protein n=1 Tax=[Myrmecia] bisecta TaxID=41462 RepID=A0AAW1PGR7_9CHLO